MHNRSDAPPSAASNGTVRVYLNGTPVDVPAGATALDAAQAWDPAVADQIRRGERRLTDSRGLPVERDAPVHGGAIFRTAGARATQE